jgi:hypothetical protein
MRIGPRRGMALRVGYPVKIPVVVVVSRGPKMKFEPLGCCGVSQLQRKMKHRVEAHGEGEEDGGSPSGGGEELAIVDGLA